MSHQNSDSLLRSTVKKEDILCLKQRNKIKSYFVNYITSTYYTVMNKILNVTKIE